MKKDSKGNNVENLEEDIIITLPLDDGKEMECEVIAIFPADGHQYVALLPTDGSESEAYLYRFEPIGEDEFNLEDIESDDEYDIAADAFEMLLDDEEFEEMGGDIE